MVFMSNTRRGIGALAATASLLLAAACGASGGTGPVASQPGQLDIVAAFYPFQFVAERVAGPYASVSNLTLRLSADGLPASPPRRRLLADERRP